MKNMVLGINLTLLVIITFGLVFNIQPIKAGDTVNFSKGKIKAIRIIERKPVVSDVHKLKEKAGVWEENRDYNLIIYGHGTGLHPPITEEWEKITEEAYIVEEVLWTNQALNSPTSVDHTSKAWFPPIGSQDGEGSCTTWAVGYYMKTFQEAKEHGWNLSEAEWEGGYKGYPTATYQNKIFSPDFIYHQINDGGDNGSSFSDAINLVCSIGACSWEKMPYNPDDSTSWPSEEAWREASLYRGNSTGTRYLWLETDADVVDLKNWIASDHLALIAVDALQYNNLTSDDVWTLNNYRDPSLNHANTIVGYNDSIEYTEDGGTHHGAFKIANSWGVGGWENIDDGCYWISYEAMKQRVGYCRFYLDRSGYEPELVASFKINHSKRGECDITLAVGNKSVPTETKEFNDWYQSGGDQPFCSNNIVFDITEFKNSMSTLFNQLFFIEVYDRDSSSTGTITHFSIEHHYNYSSSVPYLTATSNNPPVNTVNNNYVYAEVILTQTAIKVAPSSLDVSNRTSQFTIAITAANVTDLWNWQIELRWNPRFMNCTDAWLPEDNVFADMNPITPSPSIDNEVGNLLFGAGLMGPTGVNVTEGGLCQIQFTPLGPLGNCTLNFGARNHLKDSNMENIPHCTIGGVVHIVPAFHDIAVTNVACRQIVHREFGAYINVTVKNQGDYDENFNVTVYADDNIIIGTSTVNNLPAGNQTILAFYWNTSDYTKQEMYINYTISVNASQVPDEAELSNNIYSDGEAMVVLTGDANGDQWVDMTDIGLACLAYGSEPGDPKWDSRCDVNDDLFIDMTDIGYICLHYGEYFW